MLRPSLCSAPFHTSPPSSRASQRPRRCRSPHGEAPRTGAPRRSLLPPPLEWTESLDSSDIAARGIVGFDPRSVEFYSTAVNSSGPGIELLTGSMDLSEPLVLFTPSSNSRDASYTLRVIDADRFMWAPLDRGWRAVFTRER